MRRRRGAAIADRDLTNGPGKLCTALAITGAASGARLDRPPLSILRGEPVPDANVAVSPRIGISRAADWPLRWYIKDNPFVSRAPSSRPRHPRVRMRAEDTAGISERAARLYRDAIVIDTHNDLATKMLDEGYDPAVRHSPSEGHTDVPRLIESGITAQVLAAWVDAPYAQRGAGAAFERALACTDA